MTDKPLPQIPKDEKEKSNNESCASSQQIEKSNHPHLTVIKEALSDAVHHAAQTLKIEPKESHPEAYHQDGKSGPE